MSEKEMQISRETIVSAKTVDEAVALGCTELGITDSEYKFEIIELPVKKLFSFKPALAKVRVYVEEPVVTQNVQKEVPQQKKFEKPAYKDNKKEFKKEAQPTKKFEKPVENASKEIKKTETVNNTKTNETQKEQDSFINSDNLPITDPKDYNSYVKNALASLQKMLTLMELEGVVFSVKQSDTEAMIMIEGEQASYLIGRHGETMASLQYLLSLFINRKNDEYFRIIINIENYREKREKTLENLALKIARTVVKTGRSATLEPMNPYERRIIHYAVQKVEGAVSSSVGEEPNRKVVIKSKFAKRKPYNANNSKPGYDKRNSGNNNNNNSNSNNNNRPYQNRNTKPPVKNTQSVQQTEKKEPKSDFEFGSLYSKINLD